MLGLSLMIREYYHQLSKLASTVCLYFEPTKLLLKRTSTVQNYMRQVPYGKDHLTYQIVLTNNTSECIDNNTLPTRS